MHLDPEEIYEVSARSALINRWEDMTFDALRRYKHWDTVESLVVYHNPKRLLEFDLSHINHIKIFNATIKLKELREFLKLKYPETNIKYSNYNEDFEDLLEFED